MKKNQEKPPLLDYDRQKFGDRLRRARQNLTMTGKEVASIIGVSYPSYMSYENGTTLPKIETLVKLVEVLNVTSDYLIGIHSFPDRPILEKAGFKGRLTPVVFPWEQMEELKGMPAYSGRNSADISPFIQYAENLVRTNPKVNFQGKELDREQRQKIFNCISVIKAISILGKQLDVILNAPKNHDLSDDNNNDDDAKKAYMEYIEDQLKETYGADAVEDAKKAIKNKYSKQSDSADSGKD